MDDISTEERLENALKHQPDRYIAERDEKGKLVTVADKDSGMLWVKFKDKEKKERWGWVV